MDLLVSFKRGRVQDGVGGVWNYDRSRISRHVRSPSLARRLTSGVQRTVMTLKESIGSKYNDWDTIPVAHILDPYSPEDLDSCSNQT